MVRFTIKNAMVRASVSMRSAGFTRVNGSEISAMARDTNASATVISTWANMIRVESLAKGSTLGLTATLTMVNGLMELNTAMVCGKASLVTATSASGTRTKLMDTDSTSGRMVIDTRASGSSA